MLGLRIIGDGNIIAGWNNFAETNAEKLHTVLPWNDPDVPWLAVFVGGLWIPNLFYWGLNQFITQRTLGAKSLAQGQKGVFLAAWLKLLIPFIIVIPGIMAFQLYGDQVTSGDGAYSYMIKQILPASLQYRYRFQIVSGIVRFSSQSPIHLHIPAPVCNQSYNRSWPSRQKSIAYPGPNNAQAHMYYLLHAGYAGLYWAGQYRFSISMQIPVKTPK